MLEEHGLALTPNNYEVFYTYVAEENLDVVRALDAIMKSGKSPSQEICIEIYDRFITDNQTEEHVRRAGDELQSTIDSVKDAVKGVTDVTHTYNESLEGINSQLSDKLSPEEFAVVVKSAKTNTTEVMEQNKTLEVALVNSTTEIERLRKDLEKVRKESLTDSLTGLSNRKSFDSDLKRVIKEANEDKNSFCLLMLDIDHFKSFNDNFGHQAGDQVLRLVAHCLINGIKGRDIAARYGGEEFVIILPETELAAGIAVGNSLRKSIASKDVINRNTGNKLGRITMSVGVAEYKFGENVENVIERADAALYTAKHNGRNQVVAAPGAEKKSAAS